MTDTTPGAGSAHDETSIEAIRERRSEWSHGGHFIAEVVVCDEDGSVCPTGQLLFICDEGTYGPDEDPVVEAGYFSESEDAERFEQTLDDIDMLLATVDRLSAELAAANAEIARLQSYADGWAVTAMERFEECERLKRSTVIVTQWDGRASQDGD